MVSEFSFLEYKYDPDFIDIASIDDRFTRLGFIKIATHKYNNVSVWQLNFNVIFVIEEECKHDLKLSGLGFLCDQTMINELCAGYDETTDLYTVKDPNGFNILLYPFSEFDVSDSLISDNYDLIQPYLPKKSNIIDYTSGVVYNIFNDTTVEFYEKMGFRKTISGEEYVAMVAENNRFTMMFNILPNDKPVVSALICETTDVFYSTAYFINKGFEFKKYCKQYSDFEDLNYKINGYNCLADGTNKSFTIENRMIDAVPNLDVIIRQRKKYIHMHESTLKEHYNEKIC